MNISPFILFILFLAGMSTGLLGAVLGTGGGVFLIPILVIGLDVPMHHAVATSIVTGWSLAGDRRFALVAWTVLLLLGTSLFLGLG